VLISDLEVERGIEQANRWAVNVLITGGDARTRRGVAERIHEGSRGTAAPLLVLTGGEDWDVTHFATSPSLIATMFIEEVGTLGDSQQTALLHILDRHPALSPAQSVRCRIIAASASPLYDMVTRGQFQADLFYRLNLIHIVIPPP
jgi:transcriptional regulator of acetoin/glycerol metabolism